MIDADIRENSATIRVVSGALDVTYEIRPSELWSRRRTYYDRDRYTRTGKDGFVFDLAGSVRESREGQPPYIWGCMDFERAVLRAMAKARHLERAWRNTKLRTAVAA